MPCQQFWRLPQNIGTVVAPNSKAFVYRWVRRNSKGTPPTTIIYTPSDAHNSAIPDKKNIQTRKRARKKKTDLEATIRGACRALYHRQGDGVVPYKKNPWEYSTSKTYVLLPASRLGFERRIGTSYSSANGKVGPSYTQCFTVGTPT